MTDSENDDLSETETTQGDKEEQLLRAARSGKHQEIEDLLEQNPTLNVNCKGELATRTGDAVNRIVPVQFRGIFRFWIDTGKNKWNLHWTPLHLSSYFGHIQATRVLLKRGASPSEQNAEGDTPLHKVIDDEWKSASEVHGDERLEFHVYCSFRLRSRTESPW